MKKEELITKGLTEEHAKIVMDAWNESMKGFVPIERLNEATGKLKEANGTIETLRKSNADNEELQRQVNQYKNKVTELETAAENNRKTYAVKEKLAAAGTIDPDYVIYKQGGIDKFNFDKEGNPIGMDDIINPMKASSPHLFKAAPGADYTPAGGGNPSGTNPWKKETFNLTEQGRIYKENPTQARQLAAAAGVTI